MLSSILPYIGALLTLSLQQPLHYEFERVQTLWSDYIRID